MRDPQTVERRPAGAASGADGLGTSVTDPAVVRHDDDAAEVFFRTSYAVLVRGASVRRHLYFNLPAAERAVRRARDRGDRAELLLVELVPVAGGELR